MKGKEHYFEYKGAKIHYLEYEGGTENMLCFHGYGQEASYYRPLAKRLRESYTIYSFDLFYHGKSEWPDCEEALTTDFLAEMILHFLDAHSIKKINLCGYSLGGKIVLSLSEKLPQLIEKILLIAPDGIKTNFWYSMATYPYWMRRLFKYSVKKPALYYSVSKILSKLKFVDKGVIRFAEKQMNTQAKRDKVYCTWLTYRRLKPDILQLAKVLNDKQIRVQICLGVYDRIVSKDSVAPLCNRLRHCNISLLEKGHNTLISDLAKNQQPIF